ncbi:MAG: multicopper oxidase family protein [Pseudomonadales bacterium]|nr:multicopper oxidase family protein [Pseudomonadales bacterium]
MQSFPKYLCGIFSLCLLLAACSSAGPGGAGPAPLSALDVGQPEGWDADLQLDIPEDLNPDPAIIEIELEARVTDMEIIPGHMTPVWSYGGSLPGPLIRGRIGDRLIVHFKNSLPEATSIHWHGLRIGNDMDGVPGVTQDPIASGEEFTYDFVLTDAGTFWYHPHINSAAQVGWGLYGPLVVEDPADPEVFGDELVLLLSDMSLDENGQFYPTDAGGAFSDLFGREGEVLLVNGKVMPRLKVRQGKQQRWRIINAARTRYYTIRYRGQSLLRLGGDNGLAEHSESVRQIILVPGERTDLVFTPPDEPGTLSYLQWYPTERGYGSTFNRFAKKMMAIETVAASPVAPAVIPEFLRTIEPINTEGAREEEIDLTIGYDRDDNVVMGINGMDGRHHNHINIEARVGQTHIWHVTNDTDFSHPFHLHGYFFQVLDDSLVPEWKDTVDVPFKSEIRLAVKFDERPGTWMFHCHILDHAELGMMGLLRVGP